MSSTSKNFSECAIYDEIHWAVLIEQIIQSKSQKICASQCKTRHFSGMVSSRNLWTLQLTVKQNSLHKHDNTRKYSVEKWIIFTFSSSSISRENTAANPNCVNANEYLYFGQEIVLMSLGEANGVGKGQKKLKEMVQADCVDVALMCWCVCCVDI